MLVLPTLPVRPLADASRCRRQQHAPPARCAPPQRSAGLRLAGPLPPRSQPRSERRCAVAATAASAASSEGAASPKKSSFVRNALTLVALASVTTFVGSVLLPELGRAVVEALAKSGFTAAFGLIFVSELGDKTFFIAALLSMRRGRAVVLTGAVAALAVMTGISVALGRLFSRLPDSFASSLPLGEYCAAALLFFFGAKALRDALALPREAAAEGGEEREAAEAAVRQAEAGAGEGVLAGVLQTFALIFVAEWGDRSMLATIALGAAQNPLGVFCGAVGGHAGATLLAVLSGGLLSRHISERAVGLASGVLFFLFAVATLAGVF